MATYFPQIDGLETRNPLVIAETARQNALAKQEMDFKRAEMAKISEIDAQRRERQKLVDKVNVHKKAIDTGNKAQADAIFKSRFPDEEPPDWSFQGDNLEMVFERDGNLMQVTGPRENISAFFKDRSERPEFYEDPANQDVIKAGMAAEGISFKPAGAVGGKQALTPYTFLQTSEGVVRGHRGTGDAELVMTEEGDPYTPIAADVGLKEKLKTVEKYAPMNMEQYEAAQTATNNVDDINKLLDHLETSEAITGLGAEMFKNIERAKALMGDKAAKGKVSDTELLDTMMGKEVFPMIKTLGVGARGLDTPAEREFMRKVLTGSIELNKQTLIKMAETRKDVALRAIKKWNKRVGSGELDNFFEATGVPKRTIDIETEFEESVETEFEESARNLITVTNPDTGEQEVWDIDAEERIQ